MLEFVFTLSAGILIAAVSSWITVQLSLRRFRTERWWERKVDAYERVIGALHDSKTFASRHAEAALEHREVPEEASQKLRAKASTANDEILKATDMGAFLLSDAALARLQQYQKEEAKATDQPDWYLYLEADWQASNTCLKDFIQIAKRDLKAK